MSQQVVTRVSLESFRERSANKKVILLYPWTNYRNLFLSHFLESSAEGLLYYRIPGNATTINDWLTGLVQEFDNVLQGFGNHLRTVLENSGSTEELAQALASDLATYKNTEILTLYMDELDRIPFDKAFNLFIRTLVNALPDGIQVAFSSRLLTPKPWSDFIAEGSAVIMGTEYRKNDVMFTKDAESKPQVEVYAFGRGHAIINGQEITNWDGALPRNLFFYFVDNPLITRDDIFATFWPNLTVKEATNVFHVTKRKISERISMKVDDGNNYELTRYSSGFYVPSDKVVRHYDVDDFQEAVEQATTVSDNSEAEKMYRHAVDLYKAPFLENLEMEWVQERREHLKRLYAHALIGLARINQSRGDSEQALGFFTRSVKEAPEREDLHREVIKLYLGMNMPEDARNQYEHLAAHLKEAYDIEPSQETRSLIESITA